MKNILYIFCFLILISWQSVSAETEDGGYAGAFLQMAIQARPAAMGGAFIGLSDDPAGQLYNPAGLTGITKKTFTSSYRLMKLDRSLGFVSLVVPTRMQSTLGISWLYAGYGDVTARNRSGRDLGRTISSSEHVFAASFSKLFESYLSLGVKLNYYYKKIDNINANSIGLNFGGMLHIDSLLAYGTMENKKITDIKIGLTVTNLAAKYPWMSNDYWESQGGRGVSFDDKFPLAFAVGLSFRSFEKKLLVVTDLEKNVEQQMVLRFGGEYNLNDRLMLRSGLNDGTITAGIGLVQPFNRFSLGFDYAFSAEQVDEGSDHLVTLNVTF
jgi:hypothetical protein